MKYNDYINKLGFTDEELEIISAVDKKCRAEFSSELSLARKKYDEGDEAFGEYLSSFSEKCGIPVNTLNLYIYLRLLEDTYKEYERRGIDESVFLDTAASFVTVAHLPAGVGQEFGILQSVYRSWMRRNIDCTIYHLGNLEFELCEAECDMELGGRCVKMGEIHIAVHIPRGAKLKEELCEESYAQAREFFKKYYGMENIIFSCHSWLLYPWLTQVLPETSSIVKFQKKFSLIKIDENNSGKVWIFKNGVGIGEDIPTEDLPETTSLYRAAKKRLLEGKNLGIGLGIRL